MSAGGSFGGGAAGPAGVLRMPAELRPFEVRCPECRRVFDLRLDLDADEWAYGHDCEEE